MSDDSNYDGIPEIDSHMKEYFFKVMILVDSSVGKTSLMKKYCTCLFNDDYKATVGVDFCFKEIRWNYDTIVKLHFWDTAGQERFGTLTKIYFKEAHGALILFDVKAEKSKYNTTEWRKIAYKDTRDVNGCYYEPPCLLVANKTDLFESNECLSITDMDIFAEEGDFIDWKSTNCKYGDGIDDAVIILVSEMIKRDNENQNKERVDNDIVRLTNNYVDEEENSWFGWMPRC